MGAGLPVALDLPDHLRRELSAWAESEAGWTVVGRHGPPHPVAVLASAPIPDARCIVVLDAPTPADVRAALRGGALDVIAWPAERERLYEAVAGVRELSSGAGPRLFRVAGVAGGAGTSTVTLAIAGLFAWSGRKTLVVGGDDLAILAGGVPWQGPGAYEIAALHPADVTEELPGVIRAVPGVEDLHLLGGGGEALTATGGLPFDVVVADLRNSPAGVARADLLVARPDRSLLLAAGTRAPVLISRHGPLDDAMAGRALGREPLGRLPESARVARAGAAGRVPAGLPGSWLATLGAVLKARTRGVAA
ncbi:MAG: hypothetical protein ACR2KP_17910 [Egibacteraceae bacterium]